MIPEHERRLTLLLTVMFAIVGFLIKGILYYNTLAEADKANSMPGVLIAVISHREHFEERRAIRETWLADRGMVKAYFVLAAKSCAVPPQDRLDPLSCELFYPNLTQGRLFLAEHPDCTSTNNRVAIGFSFRIKYPTTVTKLGALGSLQDVKVTLLDAFTKEIRVEALIAADDKLHEGYRYRNIESIKLEKGFEGILILTGNISGHCAVSSFAPSDVIDYKRAYYDHLDEHSVPWGLDIISGVSAELSVDKGPEMGTLNVLQRRRLWMERLDSVDEKVSEEMAKYRDIVTVNVVETYRNLPRKLSEAYAHFMKQSFTFLVKVDDDVVLDLPRLKHILTTSLITQRVIWARTRRGFPISLYGKWAENVGFSSSVYPDFPCGATYVLSRDLVQFIAKNRQVLHHFQGEDVSVGAWLLGLAPTYMGDNLFSCGSLDCNDHVLNRAEVEGPKEMRRIWETHMQNKTLCS